MTFLLPDRRPPPASLPTGRQIMTWAQASAKLNAEAAWYRPLTHKQRRFVCALYANGFDVTAAMIEADPEIENEREARRLGNRMLALKSVRAAVAAVDTYYTESTKVRFEDLVDELRVIAFSSITDHVRSDGEPKPLDETNHKVVAIKKIVRRQTKYGEDTTIEMHDKLGAIEKLLKMYAPKGSGVSADDEERNGDTNVSVQTINIIPVPQGQFLPAPPETEYAHSPFIEAVQVAQIPPPPPVPVRR